MNKDIKISVTKLTNGLTVLNFFDPKTKKFGIEFMTKASSHINPTGREGLAHLTEHLVARQSKKFPTPIKQAIALEEIGAHMSAHTSHFETSYSVSGGVFDAERLIYILADTLLNPLIDEESLKAEKAIIEKEIARELANEPRMAYMKFLEIFTKGSPLTYGNLGSYETLNSIELVDVKNYIKQSYLANNSLICLWGGLEEKQAIKFAQKYFSKLRKGKWSEKGLVFKPNEKTIVTTRDSHEVNICLSFKLEKNPKLLETAKVVRWLLSSGWTSRIPSRLRLKESLIYTWGGSSHTHEDTSNLMITLSTSKESFSKVIKILSQEITSFRKNPITKDKLVHTKKQLIKPFVWGLEKAGDYANWYEEQYLYHPERIESPEEYIEKLEKITTTDIKMFVDKYITNDNWYLSVVGNVEESKLKFKI